MKKTISTSSAALIIFATLLLSIVLYSISGNGSLFLSRIYPYDLQLFLFINERHHAFFDPVMLAASSKTFWIPFYILIVFLLYKIIGKKVWITLIFIGLLIASADQIASGLIKDSVKRLRPSHQPGVMDIIHLSKAGPGGEFGFISSHAANAFALAIFLVHLLPLEYRKSKGLLICWAVLVSYSRIYNGVHYPSDVLVASFIGILLGIIYGIMYKKVIAMANQWDSKTKI